MMIKRAFRYAIRFLVFIILLTAIWFGYLYLYGNFHRVDKDVYRSAQLFPFNMTYYLKKHHIKSVLNLRGKAPLKSWYRYEVSVCKQLGIKHIDFGLPDRKRIDKVTMQKLVNVIRNAPKPLLIHCKAGADRTSLASALYLYAVKKDKDGAADQISLRYGHFPYLGSRTVAMDESFCLYTDDNISSKDIDVVRKTF